MNDTNYRPSSMRSVLRPLLVVAVVLILAAPAGAATVTWTSSSAGDWFTAGNWTNSTGGSSVPGASDDVVIGKASAQVILTNSASINSLIISNAAGTTAQLVFTNWNTTLTVGNMTIKTNGTVTLPAAFMNTAMSNRVCILCSNLMVDAGGKIDVTGKGYAGGSIGNNGYGPGWGLGGVSPVSGGGHGGVGSRIVSGQVCSQPYGSESMPVEPGSGGGGCTTGGGAAGGAGGGAIFINASNTVCINGALVANGMNPLGYAGAGSGGSIYIQCLTFASTNGSITANGGSDGAQPPTCGDGGRIAIVSDPVAQSNAPQPVVIMDARHYLNLVRYPIRLYCGTIFVSNKFIISAGLNGSGRLRGLSAWSLPSLTVSNAYLILDQDGGVNLSVDQNLTVMTATNVSGSIAGRLDIGYQSNLTFSTVACGQLVLTNDAQTTNPASMYMYAGLGVTTNAAFTNYGALLTVGNSVRITTNAWFYPISQPTNGGSVLLRVKNVNVDAGGGINANGYGFMGGAIFFANGYGPGQGIGTAGSYGAGGGGYGGAGGASYNQWTPGGGTYGSSNAPVDPGSGGGSSKANGLGCAGGGLIHMESSGTVTIDGLLTANGIDVGPGLLYNGAGSGGGIYIRCKRFAGAATGTITAKGGAAPVNNPFSSGSGGGGRVAIWRQADYYVGAYPSATNGAAATGCQGAVGTVVIGKLSVPGTIFSAF